MTAAQKAAQNRFKQAVKIASGLRKKNPKLTQAEAVKKAFATIGAPAKKAAPKKAAKKTSAKKSAPKKSAKKAPIKKAATKKAVRKKVKTILAENKLILPKGYELRKGKIHTIYGTFDYAPGIKIKKFTLSELKKTDPFFWQITKDMRGTFKHKLIVTNYFGKKMPINKQYLLEKYRAPINGKLKTRYSIFPINNAGNIDSAQKVFYSLISLNKFLNKKITF